MKQRTRARGTTSVRTSSCWPSSTRAPSRSARIRRSSSDGLPTWIPSQSATGSHSFSTDRNAARTTKRSTAVNAHQACDTLVVDAKELRCALMTAVASGIRGWIGA